MDSDAHNKPTSQPHDHNKHHQPSPSELLSSAKLVADAAKSTLGHQSDKVDKAKVAEAASDLLGAASHYGKFEDKSYGKYVDKAENYLHQYHGSHSTNTTSTATAATTGHGSGHSTTTTAHTVTSHSDDGDGHSGGGYGDYMKMAEGFFKKH